MEPIKFVLDWCQDFLFNAGKIIKWLITPIDFGFGNFAPLLGVVSFFGLTTYIVVAVAKWIVS